MANAEQAPARASPVRTDEQIVPRNRWVPIGKSNCYLDEEKSQRSPIFKILKLEVLECQLDEQWSISIKTHTQRCSSIYTGDKKRAFSFSSKPVTLVDFVNKALATIINLWPQRKTSGFERPRGSSAKILWGIGQSSSLDYVKWMWEEFINIHTLHRRQKEVGTNITLGKKKAILSFLNSKYRFNKIDIFHLQPVGDEFVVEGVLLANNPVLKTTEEAILANREPNSGKLQPLPEVPGKGKEKSRSNFQLYNSSREESSSLYAELGLSGSDTESDEGMPSVGRSGTQDEGQAGSDPGTRDEGQAGSNPGTLDEGQAGSDPGTRDEGQAGPNPDDVAESLPLPTPSGEPEANGCRQVIPEEPVSSTGTLSSLQHLAKDFSFGDQFLNDKPSEADNEKTTADTEAESRVSITIQQDTSIIPPMTSPVIDLVSRPDSPNVYWPLPTTTTTAAPTTTTTTTTLPLPPQPQQGSSESLLIKRMGELEQHIANLVDENQALETRLTKQGSRIIKLESVDVPKMIREQTVEFIDSQEIDRKINESVKEVVSSSVKHAMRAPLRARFKDLPTSDMKEILLQRMLEENYDKGHAEHRVAYEALQGSIHRDEDEDFDDDKAQVETKKKGKQDSPKPPPGSPPSPPPPPPPPSGASGASGTTGASDSAQAPPPPPPVSSTRQEDQSTSTAAPSSSKTAASAAYSAWTTTDSQTKPSITQIPDDLYMDEGTTADDQALSSDDEVGRDHIPTVNLKQSWWKPLTEDRPSTPEPAWTIPSSDLSMQTNNWASALKSTYAPPQENSLLAQTGDMATFMDWFCKQRGISELTPNPRHKKQQNVCEQGPGWPCIRNRPSVSSCRDSSPFQNGRMPQTLTDQWMIEIHQVQRQQASSMGGEPGHVSIQPVFFFQKRTWSSFEMRRKMAGHRPGQSRRAIKAACYPDVDWKLVHDQFWIAEE
ncbi:hypothetical protein Tco_0308678 [Tanacetum coccineum]